MSASWVVTDRYGATRVSQKGQKPSHTRDAEVFGVTRTTLKVWMTSLLRDLLNESRGKSAKQAGAQ